MFLTSDNYTKYIRKLLAESNSPSLAVAFWGSGSETLITPTKGKTFKVICNLMTGGTNPDPIEKLRNTNGIEIHRLDDLHAKVIIGTQSAIVGSANFSANGLNLENEEIDGWEEAGLLVYEPDKLVAIQQWFDKLWKRSSEITDDNIAAARKLWDARRKHRPTIGKAKTLLQIPPHELKDKVYLAFYREDASKKAEKAFNSKKNEIANRGEQRELSFFEDWEDLPKNASLISVRFGPRKGIRIEGSYKRIPELDTSYSENGATVPIQLVYKEDKILGTSFDQEQCNSLKKRLQPFMKKYEWKDEDVIHQLSEAIALK